MGRVKTSILIFSILISASCLAQQNPDINPKKVAIAKLPTPVFNIPDFPFIFGGRDGKTLKSGKCGQIWNLEFIALPGTVFEIEDTLKTSVYRVKTGDYPSKKTLFIDSRFVKITANKPPERPRNLPSKEEIIKRLLSAKGNHYLWGGNIGKGIPEMLSFYPPSSGTADDLREGWILKGLDCSGLLYEVTGGYTPRNTEALMDYGNPVLIAGLNAQQIVKKIKPLDLIVWKGHVIIILDKKRAIESRLEYDMEAPQCQGGVRVRPLEEVLEETLKHKMPVDKYEEDTGGKKEFVIRRWHP